MDTDMLKKTLRPRAAWLLIVFSLVYISIIEVIFPLFNSLLSLERPLPMEAHAAVLALTLAQPLTYVVSRTVEKTRGQE